MYLISINRSKFIRSKFFETSFGINKIINTQDLAKLSSPQLHYLASIFNWDDDKGVLTWIINSPKCDKATALLIFWRAEPDYYTRFGNEQEANYDADVFRLIKNIIQNFEAGFYQRAKIEYDPEADGHDIHYVDPRSKWQIPAKLKQAIRGRSIYSMLDVFNLIGHIVTVVKNKSRRQIRRLKRKVAR